MKQNSTSHDSINRFDRGQGSQWRASLIALAVTLILHVVLLFLLPDELFMRQSVTRPEPDEAIELTLEQPDPEKPRYVEVNPEAPENEPDRNNRYSFRSQQAADENPDTSPDDVPTVEGEEASLKIVQGSVDASESIPLESGTYKLSEESVENQGESANVAPPSHPNLPLPAPDFIQQKPEVEEGTESRLKVLDSDKQVVKEDLAVDAPLQLYRMDSENQPTQEPNRASNAADEAKPLPRKRLTLPPDLVHGPLMRSKSSASRRGAIGIDATFSQFGEYEQQFYAAVQAGWYQEIDFFQPIDTSANVVVQFRIHSDGTVDEVKILQSTASEIATLICQTALTKLSPFRPWTKEMVEVFGQERVIEVTFSYR